MSGKSKAEQLKESVKSSREIQPPKTRSSKDVKAADVEAALVPQDVRAKPVRVTLDLSAHRHAALKKWSAETAEMLGSARITSREVITALLSRLMTDERLAREIREELGKK